MAARRSLGWGLAIALTAMGAAFALRAGGGGARRDGRRRAGAGRGAPAEEEAVDGKIERTEAEWREVLTPEQFRIMRRRGTERPFTGRYCHHDAEGLYRCAGCGQALFDAATKYASGSGWPSFKAPHAAGHVEERPDASLGVTRTEVVCSRCDAHLGHVFDDGPAPAGRRYCINSAALDFEPAQETRKAMFGAGCFWGVEAAFRRVEGVVETAVGYSGGWKESPTYEEVCTDRTGHVEVVLVTYDPKRVPYETLLEVFWRCHDPTQRNRQGPDAGRQYRSVIFTFDGSQRRAAEISREALTRSGRCKRPIATEIEEAGPFWRAEEYHQRFYEKTGRRGCGLR